jgi:tRNA 2-thiouridine synthesizing protein A
LPYDPASLAWSVIVTEAALSPDRTLDCTGLYCPQPVVRTAAQVREMQPGQVLEVIGDDPGMQIDIPAWCTSHGHEFLAARVWRDRAFCYIRVSG